MDHLPEHVDWVTSNIRPGFEPRFRSVGSPGLWQTLPRADFLVLFGAKITAEMIAAAPNLNLIQLAQVGYDNVDVAAATRAGVPVCNTPGVVEGLVAEHALMLILATMHRLLESDASVRRGEWPQMKLWRKGLRNFPAGATLGIVGFGGIGKELARICRPLASEILYYKRHRLPVDEERQLGVTYAPLEDLLRRSDVVSLHVPLNEKTRGLIGHRELSLMRPSAILVNTARGPIVDHDALIAHLRTGQIGGVGLDVLWEEPPPPDMSDSPLLTFDNVAFTPHTGSASWELSQMICSKAFENVYRVAAGEEPLNRV